MSDPCLMTTTPHPVYNPVSASRPDLCRSRFLSASHFFDLAFFTDFGACFEGTGVLSILRRTSSTE